MINNLYHDNLIRNNIIKILTMVDSDFDLIGDEWFDEELSRWNTQSVNTYFNQWSLVSYLIHFFIGRITIISISVFIRVLIQASKIKIRLVDRAYIDEV